MKALKEFKKKASLNYLNSKGFKTGRKIIVIESDDWGAIRMPNKNVYNQCLKEGLRVDNCPYNRYDTLACNDDFTAIFNSLSKFSDKWGNSPIITINAIMANPNFSKIASENFKKYHYEPFTKTIDDYYPGQNVFANWHEGIEKKLIKPQFHGREHLYVKRWLNVLSEKSEETLFTFDNNFFGISTTITNEDRKTYLAALDLVDIREIEEQKEILKDGLQIFKNTFKFDSQSFIAPNYTWRSELEPYLKELGVMTIQGARAQREPTGTNTYIKKHKMGYSNRFDQTYLIRNVEFEPSHNKNVNWKKYVINQVKNAFFWKQPAIISSHRLNYIGGLDEKNRTENLIILEEILKKILKKWPDVEFMTSDQLGELIRKESENG